jgi:CRISPR-associated endonuclease/helicase Cas3
MLEKILAKRVVKDGIVTYQENLITHTNKVLDNLKELKITHPEFDSNFWEACFLMCLFHDAGKISENFQLTIKNEVRDENIRHELLSGVFLMFFDQTFQTEKALFTAAIFSHHSPLNDEIFDRHENRKLKLKTDLANQWFSFALKKANEHKALQKPFNTESLTGILELDTKDYVQVFIQDFLSVNKQNWKQTERAKYIPIKAILNICDWSASGDFNPNAGLIFTLKKLIEQLRIKINNPDAQFSNFQNQSLQPKNVIAIAPTGSGKTEASLIWASQKAPTEKVIYCLPTKVTSNSIYERMKDYFGNDACSVVHSSALLYRKKVDEEYKEYLRDKTFFKNITVCTIDQILTQGFNLGYWEVKTFHCKNAWVVIDEIHLYDGYTLALILETIKYLRLNFGTRFYIMSATMPSKLKSQLKTALGTNTIEIADDQLLDESRNTFEVKNCTVQDNLAELIAAIQTKDKVLVVVNTVDQAIDLYHTLLKDKSSKHEYFCFHSRFIQKDRLVKEKQILAREKSGKPIVVIATQVVEVSLDIDFDIMFTENAPIDAIIQRAGRVNRKRSTKKDSKIIVHQHSEVSKDYVYKMENVLENTFREFELKHNQPITEREFLQMVDRVYANIDVEESESFKDGKKAYRTIQRDYFYIGDCERENEKAMTREMDSVSVVPVALIDDFTKTAHNDRHEFELSVNRERYRKLKSAFQPTEEIGFFKFIDGTYDEKVGLIFPEKTTLKTNKSMTF